MSVHELGEVAMLSTALAIVLVFVLVIAYLALKGRL